jgi:hypothetical protein
MVRFREMRGLKEHAKERSLSSGTGGGRRSGRGDGFPYPTRPQWVGLCVVAARNGEPSPVAGVGVGSKRTATSLERQGWIQWAKPETARFPGWTLTALGVVAKHSGDLRFGKEQSAARDPR